MVEQVTEQGGVAPVAAPAAATGVRRRTGVDRAPGTSMITPYLFIAPFFIVYAIFMLYPVFDAFRLSFYRRIGVSEGTWTGLDNYHNLFTDERYLEALKNTTIYATGSVFILSPLALVLALLVRSFVVPWPNLQSLYRVAFFLPNITSAVVIALMFGLVFDTDYGVLNAALEGIGLERHNWLRSETLALPSVILVSIWTYLGLNSLYFLAGLQNIPDELNEAATVDGASRFQILRDITLPLLKPTILFVITQAVIFSYQVFEIPFLLTQGGPSDASLTLAIYLYQVGFTEFDQGYAAAIGYSLALISIVLAGLQYLLFRVVAGD